MGFCSFASAVPKEALSWLRQTWGASTSPTRAEARATLLAIKLPVQLRTACEHQTVVRNIQAWSQRGAPVCEEPARVDARQWHPRARSGQFAPTKDEDAWQA
eukprot:13440893-Alexandrium_andersonii.AAC.1